MNKLDDLIIKASIIILTYKFLNGGWKEVLEIMTKAFYFLQVLIEAHPTISISVIGMLAYIAYHMILLEWEQHKIWKDKDEISDWYNGY